MAAGSRIGKRPAARGRLGSGLVPGVGEAILGGKARKGGVVAGARHAKGRGKRGAEGAETPDNLPMIYQCSGVQSAFDPRKTVRFTQESGCREGKLGSCENPRSFDVNDLWLLVRAPVEDAARAFAESRGGAAAWDRDVYGRTVAVSP